jgi:hypothetical protein
MIVELEPNAAADSKFRAYFRSFVDLVGWLGNLPAFGDAATVAKIFTLFVSKISLFGAVQV